MLKLPFNTIVFLGTSGFLLLLLYDLLTLKKVSFRFVVAFLGYGMQVTAVTIAVFSDNKLHVGGWVVWLGWLLLLSGVSWLVYSLYLFGPIRQTYWDENGPALTTEGPYAVCRHPGIYGYTVSLIGLTIITRSLTLLFCSIIWSLVNVGYIYLQDSYLFVQLFEGYKEYCKNTPMLIPTKKGVKRFWATK